eukprot:3396473-Rhodomonas_salina.1
MEQKEWQRPASPPRAKVDRQHWDPPEPSGLITFDFTEAERRELPFDENVWRHSSREEEEQPEPAGKQAKPKRTELEARKFNWLHKGWTGDDQLLPEAIRVEHSRIEKEKDQFQCLDWYFLLALSRSLRIDTIAGMSALTIPPFFSFTRPEWPLEERRRLAQTTGTRWLWMWSLLSDKEKTHLHAPSDGWFLLTWRKKGLTAAVQT